MTPRIPRVIFTGDLESLDYAPVRRWCWRSPCRKAGRGTGRRDYTIRKLDRAAGRPSIGCHALWKHAGAELARRARAGDMIRTRPRGRTVINPGADWYVFCRDEICPPAILPVLERTETNAKAAQFSRSTGQQIVNRFRRLSHRRAWVHRNGQPPGTQVLLDRLETFDLSKE